MLGAIGVGIKIGDNPLRMEWCMHQHTRQTLQLAPLLVGGIIVQADSRPRLIDQFAAFIAGDQESARGRAI